MMWYVPHTHTQSVLSKVNLLHNVKGNLGCANTGACMTTFQDLSHYLNAYLDVQNGTDMLKRMNPFRKPFFDVKAPLKIDGFAHFSFSPESLMYH